jgi:2,4-dienoyl-CoA reductase-like NADH-dependent reductase (Old Yellow Enzyme family)
VIFEPITINGVTFSNRLLRSSIGGRTAYYDGTVTNAWKNFELRFAQHGIGGIISATLNVDPERWSPLEYPQISTDEFVHELSEGVAAVQQKDCPYIIQIGDHGYHTQTSLFSEEADQKSASKGFDLIFGYRTSRSEMSISEIEKSVQQFADAAVRVKKAGCDGLEVTASKGYLIHQFLNPATNRRTDRYGGSVEKRFRLLREVVTAVREAVGHDYLFGVRLSANDFNYLPVNLRWPPVRPLRHYWFGNTIKENLKYARQLKELGVNYLHIDNGFGFINPKGNPGSFPVDEARMFFNSTRHLSRKAALRAALLNLTPGFFLRPLLNIGWGYQRGVNLEDARRFRQEVGLPIIANGGFQQRSYIEQALTSGACDMVSMARPLLANPDLPRLFRQGKEEPERPCTFCNRCTVRTTLFPLGCYEPKRFLLPDGQVNYKQMEKQIYAWSANPEEVSIPNLSSNEYNAPAI